MYNGHMTHILTGDHIAKKGKIRIGCSAVIFDLHKEKVLLTRRTDNGMWCLPGGMIEPGESVTEGCAREVFEETGLRVSVVRLVGVYSDPDQVVVYPDGNQVHMIVLNFETKILEGIPGLSEETSGVDWFLVDHAVNMDLFHNHADHIRDALTAQAQTFIR
jgi:8-oxo-dGTP pyrophosphatase MutT (NUDIX family)